MPDDVRLAALARRRRRRCDRRGAEWPPAVARRDGCAAADVDGFVFFYDYARDEHGNCVCVLWRERLLRRAAGYTGRAPSTRCSSRPTASRPARAGAADDLRYVHNRPADRYDPDRNLKILRAKASGARSAASRSTRARSPTSAPS
jgi:hypothetical protein